MATAKPSKLDEEILICSICLDTLKDPKILECLHRFCKPCISKVVDQVPATDNVFPCPTCRHEVHVPEGGADGLKGDFLLADILESRAIERSVLGEQEEQPCGSCGKHSAIVAICPDCGGFLCESCLSSHRTLRALQLHSHVVTLADIQSGKVAFNASALLSATRAPKCTIHKDMTLHINCMSCDKLICPVCAPIHHHGHQLEEIDTTAQRVKGDLVEALEEIQDTRRGAAETLNEFKKAMERRETVFAKSERELDEYCASVEESIISGRDAALGRVRKIEAAIVHAAETRLGNLQRAREIIAAIMKNKKSYCNSFEGDALERMTGLLSRLSNVESTALLLSEEANNWRILLGAHDLRETIDALAEEPEISDPLPDDDDLILDDFDFKSTSCLIEFDDFEWARDSDSGFIPSVPSGMLSDVKCLPEKGKLAMVGIHCDDSIITSGIYTEEERAIDWDSYSKEFPGMGRNVLLAAVENGVIFHTVEIDGTNKLVDTQSGKCVEVLPASGSGGASVTCIAQISNNEMIVGVDGSNVLHRCDFQGEVLSTIQLHPDEIGPPVSVATTEDGDMYLCDDRGQAVAVSREGELKCRYRSRYCTDKALKIAIDRRKFVYVLWEVWDDPSGKGGEDGDFDNLFSECDNDSDEESSKRAKRVTQYTTSGTFVSCFEVHSDVTMLATMYKDEDNDALVAADTDGCIYICNMTDEKDLKICKAAQKRDAKGGPRARRVKLK